MATLSQLLIELKNTQTMLDEFDKEQIDELKGQLVECDSNLKGFEIVRESLRESLDEDKNRLLELKNERMDLINAMIKDVNREPPKTKPKSVEVKLPEKQMLENRSKNSQPPSNVIRPPTKKMNPEPVNAKESTCKSSKKSPKKVQQKSNLSRKQKQLQAQAKSKKIKQPRDDKMIQFGNYSWGEPRCYKFSLDEKPMSESDMVQFRRQLRKEKRGFRHGPYQCLCKQCLANGLHVTGNKSFIIDHQVEVYKPKYSCVKCLFSFCSFSLSRIKKHLKMHEDG